MSDRTVIEPMEPVTIPADILAEMEELARAPSSRKYQWSPEQDAVILKGVEMGLSYVKIARLLRGHYGDRVPKEGVVNQRHKELTGGTER